MRGIGEMRRFWRSWPHRAGGAENTPARKTPRAGPPGGGIDVVKIAKAG
jgi:hypothetical protein